MPAHGAGKGGVKWDGESLHLVCSALFRLRPHPHLHLHSRLPYKVAPTSPHPLIRSAPNSMTEHTLHSSRPQINP